MALNKTRYGRKAVLDHFLGRVSYAFPTNVYMGLSTSDPTELGSMAGELTETGYARIEISALMSDAVLASGQIANSAEITFGPAGEDWPEVTHGFIADSATIGAGNMIYFGPAVTSRTVNSGDDFPIRVGQLTIQER
jgi:hypothetical protein